MISEEVLHVFPCLERTNYQVRQNQFLFFCFVFAMVHASVETSIKHFEVAGSCWFIMPGIKVNFAISKMSEMDGLFYMFSLLVRTSLLVLANKTWLLIAAMQSNNVSPFQNWKFLEGVNSSGKKRSKWHFGHWLWELWSRKDNNDLGCLFLCHPFFEVRLLFC